MTQPISTAQVRRMDAILKRPENKECMDCTSKQPRWASTNLGVFFCLRCAGFHRALGTHISKVKSTNMDAWEDAMLDRVDKIGNANGKLLYEARLPPGYRKPDVNADNVTMERVIRNKYELKLYRVPNFEELWEKMMNGQSASPTSVPAPLPSSPTIVTGKVIQKSVTTHNVLTATPVKQQQISQAPPAQQQNQQRDDDFWGGFHSSPTTVAQSTSLFQQQQQCHHPQPLQQTAPQQKRSEPCDPFGISLAPARPAPQGTSPSALDDFFSPNTTTNTTANMPSDNIMSPKDISVSQLVSVGGYQFNSSGGSLNQQQGYGGRLDDLNVFGTKAPPTTVGSPQQPASPSRNNPEDAIRNVLSALEGSRGGNHNNISAPTASRGAAIGIGNGGWAAPTGGTGRAW